MKQLSLLIIGGLLLLATLLPAQSFDLSLDGSGSFARISDVSAGLSQNASIAINLPIAQVHRLRFKLGANVGMNYGAGELSFTYPAAIGDIDLQELSYSFNGPVEKESMSNFNFDFGRFTFADNTNAIYAYRLDGALIQASFSAFHLRAVAGYTGFLPRSAPIIASGSDTLFGNFGFAPPRLIAGFNFKTTIIPQHEIYAAFLTMEDIRNVTQLIPEWEDNMDTTGMTGSSDASYFDVGFTGALNGELSYSGYGIFKFGRSLAYIENSDSATGYTYRYIPTRAFSFSAGARYILSPGLNLSGRLLFGSGDGNDANTDTAYKAITRLSSGLVFAPQPTNLSFLEAVVNYKPFPKVLFGFESVQASSKTLIFLKNGEGVISEAGVDPDSGFSLLGIEEDLSAVVRLTSDFTANLALGLFLPFAAPLGAFLPSFTANSPLMFTIRAGFSLTL